MKLMLFFLAAPSAAMAQPAATEINEANKLVVQSYWQCVTEKALSLVSSGEDANTIAEVGIRACDGMISLAADAANVEWHRTTPGLLNHERETGRPIEARQQILELLRKEARSQAISAVVEAKAKRADRK